MSQDFPNGLSSVNEYLDTRHHINKDIVGEVGTEARVVLKSEYDFTLREIICNLLAGRGLKLPNIQVCLSVNLKAILGVAGIQQDLKDALDELDKAFDEYMEHTGIEQTLGRINNALSEVTQIANMINFCATPVDPIAIPNVLEQTMDSFLGAGKDIIDKMGSMIPNQIGGCLSFNGQEFNLNLFNGGLLGEIASDWNNIKSGNLTQARLDALVATINGIKTDINSLMDRENNVVGVDKLGGSEFEGDIPATQNTQMGVLHNADLAGIQGNTRIASMLKAQFDRLGGYPVIDKDGNVYDSIFELILEPGLIDKLKNLSDPTPEISTTQPVYNYCGEIVGYTQAVTQDDPDTSTGTVPTTITDPGYNAAGLDTVNPATAGSQNVTNITNITTGSNGSKVFFATSDNQMLNLGAVQGDIVVRTDQGLSYVHNGGSTGTTSDFTNMVTTSSHPFTTHLANNASTGIVVKNGNNSQIIEILGTANEINVFDGNGINGNPTLRLASNPVIPGNSGIQIPAGTTAERANNTAGNIRYNTTTGAYEGYFGTSNNWQTFSTGGVAVLGAANLGTGNQLFAQNNNGTLEFRSITSAGAVTLQQTGNEIAIAENLTASNVGGGQEVLKQRNGNNFEHRTIVAGQNITVTTVGDTIEIAGDENQIKMDPQTSSGPGATEILFNGSRVSPPNNTSWFFEATAVGRRTNGPGYMTIKLQGMVDNNNGIITVVQDSANKTIFSNTAGNNWDLRIDSSQGDFRVVVDGALGADISWAAKLDIIPVS